MTSRLYIAKVGGGTIELTGFTGLKGAPFLDRNDNLIELGHRFANGEASQGTFKLLDPVGELARTDFEYNLPAHKLVTWTEDASGDEIWLSRGRVSTYDGGRGFALAADQVEYDATVDDGNVDLRGQAFVVPWVRPAETGWARLMELQAYTLNGAASTATNHRDSCDITIADSHLAPATNLVVMPAKTYPAGTQPQDVITECADTENKVYGVVIHHTGGSHLCLLYINYGDNTVYTSPIKISDQLSEWDPEDLTAPVFEPHWEMGKASIYDGQQLLSGLVSTWGADQSVFSEHADNITDYDYWVDHFGDAESETLSQAESVNASERTWRQLTHVTHRVSIIMLPEQVHLVTAGMSLQIKATAAIAGQYLGTYQTRRVAELSFRPRSDGRYWADMHLDRAIRRRAYRQGGINIPKPASSSVPTVRAFGFSSGAGAPTVDGTPGIPAGLVNSALYIFNPGRHDDIEAGADEWGGGALSGTYGASAMELLAAFRHPDSDSGYAGAGASSLGVFRILSPASGVHTVSTLDALGGERAAKVWVLLENVPQADPEANVSTNTGTGTVSSAPVSGGGLVLDMAAKYQNVAIGTPPTPGAGQIAIHASNVGGLSWGSSYGSSAPVHTFPDAGTKWVAAAVAVNGVGGVSQPVGATGTGTIGPADGTYVGPGHAHEHGNITAGGPYHEAADVTFAPTGTIAATNVQTALEEVVAEATSGAPTTADYLVGTANAGLSAEIVVGTTPGGELGGTWASPTVDATHSGSTHSTATDAHIADGADAHDASAISVVPFGTIAAADVQAALEEIVSEATGGTDDQTATEVPFDDTGLTITAANVQEMGEELDAAISAGGIPATIFDAAGDIIVASAADTAARLAAGSEDDVLTIVSGVPAWAAPTGGSSRWTQVVNESGASFTPFTAASGTWASDGTIITQSDTSTNFRRAKYNTKVPWAGGCVHEAEIRFPSSGQSVAATRRAGLIIGFNNGQSGILSYLEEDSNNIGSESDGTSALNAVSVGTIAQDTWYKLRLVSSGRAWSIYLDGTHIGDIGGTGSFTGASDFVGLYTYGAKADFRNIKAWVATADLPA